MTLSLLLCSDKHLTIDVSIVQNVKMRYGGLLLVDNHSCIALYKALRKATFDVALVREGDDQFSIDKERTIFPTFKLLSC